MTLYNILSEKILLPISDVTFGTDVSNKLHFLEKSQWWTPTKLEDYQNKKLRALIKHAYNNVPYYHNLFKSLNLNPEDIKSKDDLVKLPTISKNDMQNNINDFIAVNVRKSNLINMSTSGSSGIPFEYFVDKTALSIFRSMGLRGWQVAGYNLGDKLATVSGSSLLPNNINFIKNIMYKANRNLPLTSFNMNNEKVSNYVKRLIDFNPNFIRGYPSSISIIANYILNNDININLSAVITTAETLSNYQRKIIMDAFNCDVFDQCGCGDGGEFLFECIEHSGYHVGCERSIHEFISENGKEYVSNNEIGNIVLTDLWNYSMPFIRYDAGDLAIPTDERCLCGRGLPLVKSIVGRSADQIVLPDGSLLPGLTFTDILDNSGINGNAHKIDDYQIIQEKINKFTINLVINNNYCEDTTSEILNFFESHMGIPLDINFKFVDTIPKTKANKRKLIISKVYEQRKSH